MKCLFFPSIVFMSLFLPVTGAQAQHPDPVLVKDFNAGPDDGFRGRMHLHNGRIYLTATNGTNGVEVWTSDGTEAGTEMLRNINVVVNPFPVDRDASPHNFASVGDKVLFSAIYNNTGVEDRELFITDGTTAGTRLLKNINRVTFDASSDPEEFVVLNNKVLFFANDGIHGHELWITDTTTAGTVLLEDINPGSAGSIPRALKVIGNRAYFSATDGVHGRAIWVTDGTAAGTVQLKDLDPASTSGGSYLAEFTEFAGKVFFMATHTVYGMELWVTDGTEAGTRLLKDINPGSGGSSASYMEVIGDRMYFSADDGVHGVEPWITDGTEAGTRMLKDILPGSDGSHAFSFTTYNDKVFFSAKDDTHGRELWVTDGTTAGTQLYLDIVPGATGSEVISPRVYNNRLYFVTSVTTGVQWMCLEGDTLVPIVVKPAAADVPGSIRESVEVVEMNGSMYFDAHYDSGTGRELYKITTTPYVFPAGIKEAGAMPVWHLYPNPSAGDLIQVKAAAPIIQALSVYDLSGKLVYRQAFNKPQQTGEFPCASWPAGIYQVVIRDPNGHLAAEPFIKQ